VPGFKKCRLIDEDWKDEGQVFGSKWVLTSDDADFLELPEIKEESEWLAPRADTKIWTDDYSNLYQILKK
jgi:hypothetical protein